MTNLYQVLGVSQNATSEQIKTSYREFAKHFHPDMHQNSEFFKRRFQEIQQAYDILSDTTSRKDYDKKLADLKSNPNHITKIEELNSKVEELNKQIRVEKIMSQQRREQYDIVVIENIELTNKVKELTNKNPSLSSNNKYHDNKTVRNLKISVIILSLLSLYLFSAIIHVGMESKHEEKEEVDVALVNMNKVYDRMKVLAKEERYNEVLTLADSLFKYGKNIDTSRLATFRNGRVLEKADYFTIRGYGKSHSDNDTGAVRDYTLSILNHKIPNSQPFIGRASLKANLGDISSAFSDINQAIILSPNNSNARNIRANMFYERSNYELALKDYKIASLNEPTTAAYLYMIGECYSNIGKKDSACVYWRKSSEFGFKEGFERIAKLCK